MKDTGNNITLAELESSDEAILVSRILVQLHKSIDENFPHTLDADDQFKRTVFSTEESTETGKMAAAQPVSELEAQLDMKAEVPRALDRRPKPSSGAQAPAQGDQRQFFEGETTGRKPFEHPIESKADVASIFAIIVFILGLIGVGGFIFLLFM